MKYALATLIAFGILLVVAQERVSASGTWPFVGSPAAGPAPTPTLFIPVGYAINGVSNGSTAEMGATADTLLVSLMEVNAEPTPSAVNGCTSACKPVKYINLFWNFCTTDATTAAYTYGNGTNENAFLHIYPNGITSGNRLVLNGLGTGTCGSYTSPLGMNAGDSAFNTWLYANVWTNTTGHYFPSPYGVFEDNGGVVGPYVCGIGSTNANYPSTEYGGGNYPTIGRCDVAGTSTHAQGFGWQQALDDFASAACGATCLNVAFNGAGVLAGGTLSCNDVSGSHCHAYFSPQYSDNQYILDQLCSGAPANLIGAFQEKPIVGQRIGAGNYPMASAVNLIALINTLPRYYANCPSTFVLYDLEYGNGPLGPGGGTMTTAQQNSSVYFQVLQLAMHMMVANPSTSVPDRWRMMNWGALGSADSGCACGAANEAPYYFIDMPVPYVQAVTPAQFVWGAATSGTNFASCNGNGGAGCGGGCDSTTANTAQANGDTGGAIALLSGCDNSGTASNDGAGVYCNAYSHFYINGTDHGAAEACVNTSASANPTLASLTPPVAFSNYNYALAPHWGELTSVPNANAGGGTITLSTCSSGNCVGVNTLSGQTTSKPTNICDQWAAEPCGIILLQNNT